MRFLTVVVALGACGGSGPPAPAPPLAAPPLMARAETVARTSPAPSIAWAGAAFKVDRVPAVARAGEVVVVAVHDNDAGRGWPNLRLEVHDRNDKVIQSIRVMSSNEYEALVAGDRPTPALEQRIAAANSALAELHGVHDLVAMHALEVQPPPEGDEPHFAVGDGMDIDFSRDHLHVFPHNTDRPLASRDVTGWLTKDHKPCAQCVMCENPAYLDGVFHTTGIDLVVIELGYRGNDTCWEPGHQLHVIAW